MKVSIHKRCHKMGQLPGDVRRQEKILMLESKPSQLEAKIDRSPRLHYWPVEPKRAKAYKREYVRQANRAVRHAKVEVEVLDP